MSNNTESKGSSSEDVYSIRKISVCIPVYNEEGSLPELYEKLCSALEASGLAWEAVLVNDGSMDGSREILNDLSDRDERIKVIHFRINSGQTAAMMAGMTI